MELTRETRIKLSQIVDLYTWWIDDKAFKNGDVVTHADGSLWKRDSPGKWHKIKKDRYTLQAEAEYKKNPFDKNGNHFVKNKNGDINLGYINKEQAKAMGKKPAPIRLSEGHGGLGNAHALKHLKELPGHYETMADFVDDIVNSYLLSGKYKYVHANDITDVPDLFMRAINGEFRNERRWISREDFFNLKDHDTYVRLCWSFSNNGEEYLYSKEVEPWKKAYHYARVRGDYSLIREFYNTPEQSPEKFRIYVQKHHDEIKAAYIDWYKKTYFKDKATEVEEIKADIAKESEKLRLYLIEHRDRAGLKSSDVDKYLGTNGMAGHYFGRSQWEFPTLEIYEKLRPVMKWKKEYPITYFLAQSLQRLERLSVTRGSYKDVPMSFIHGRKNKKISISVSTTCREILSLYGRKKNGD